jgi:hypothetical protein
MADVSKATAVLPGAQRGPLTTMVCGKLFAVKQTAPPARSAVLPINEVMAGPTTSRELRSWL